MTTLSTTKIGREVRSYFVTGAPRSTGRVVTPSDRLQMVLALLATAWFAVDDRIAAAAARVRAAAQSSADASGPWTGVPEADARPDRRTLLIRAALLVIVPLVLVAIIAGPVASTFTQFLVATVGEGAGA